MYDERLGSYSIAATRAGTPSLRRLKSILRYSRLAPPPRWREVLRPCVLRPPDFVRPSVSDFSGSPLVTSEKSGYVAKRRPGLVGFGFLMAIRCSLPGPRATGGAQDRAGQGRRAKPMPGAWASPRTQIQRRSCASSGGAGVGERASLLERLQSGEDRDLVLGPHLHDCLLPGSGAAGGPAAALGLGLDRRGADVEHLDGLADLRLVCVGMDAERVLAGRRQHVGLLGHDRADDDLAGFHHTASLARTSRLTRSVSRLTAASESTSHPAPTRSATPTSSTPSTRTWRRLRNERCTLSSSGPVTTNSGCGSRQPSSPSAACLVDGSANAPASTSASELRPACSDSALRRAARRSLRLTLTV